MQDPTLSQDPTPHPGVSLGVGLAAHLGRLCILSGFVWWELHPYAASRGPKSAGAGWGVHRVPPVPASPSCLSAALQSSEQLMPAVGVVEAWPGAFPGLQGAEGLGRGEQGHPSPCLADKPGLARRKEVCWALQGAASGASTSALPGLLACCTWACGTSGPARAEATRLHCVWTAAGPPSPLRRVPPARWGLRKHGCADSGRKPPST